MTQSIYQSTIESRSPRILEENLSAFAYRFPVSGRIVHALAQETGGVVGLAARLEQFGFWDEVQAWMVTGKPKAIHPEEIREIFPDHVLRSVALELDIPLESVEIQASLGIPKFFTTLARDEDDDGLLLGYSAKQRGTKHSFPRVSASRRMTPFSD